MPVDPDAHTAVFPTAPPAPSGPRAGRLIVPALVGAAVAVSLGVYGREHTPTGVAVNIAGFSGPLAVKAWLTTLAATLAVVQLLSALVMYGKIGVSRAEHGGRTPSWIGPLHRWSGRVAFLAAVPVALHCLYALGAQSYDTRVTVHSVLGCFFFGAFTSKMLLLRASRVPGWALPLLGGLVFSGLIALWLTSSLWFFQTYGITT